MNAYLSCIGELHDHELCPGKFSRRFENVELVLEVFFAER